MRRLTGTPIGMLVGHCSVPLVIDAQGPEHRGHERVVERATGSLGAIAEIGEGNVEDEEPVAGPDPVEQGGPRAWSAG